MLNDLSYALVNFLDKGGIVLWAILGLTMFLFILLVERLVYLGVNSKKVQRQLQHKLSIRSNEYELVRLNKYAKEDYFKGFGLIQVCIAMLPLFGLLGTVTGMIEVFDVMASFGNSNPRLMASGVSKAIIPTMAGMAIAVFALLSFYIVKAKANKQLRMTTKELNKVYNASF